MTSAYPCKYISQEVCVTQERSSVNYHNKKEGNVSAIHYTSIGIYFII
jgi:hypothetical protein